MMLTKINSRNGQPKPMAQCVPLTDLYLRITYYVTEDALFMLQEFIVTLWRSRGRHFYKSG